MKIAITSGKGGTGKTTVAVNLAKIISVSQPTQYIDCDVEEPNGHLFLNPSISTAQVQHKMLASLYHILIRDRV